MRNNPGERANEVSVFLLPESCSERVGEDEELAAGQGADEECSALCAVVLEVDVEVS